RRAHARELAPRVAQPRDGTAGCAPLHTITDPGPTVARSQLMNSVHAPVTSAIPTPISSAPPTRVTQRLLRRTARNTPINRRKPSPKARNGSPSPRQYATVRVTARPGSPPTAASPSTAASVGPTHGTQPSANTAPNTGAPSRPA